MAYNDLAQFLPQEGGFKMPGQYNRMLQAESMKKAAYLSEMDKFYSQLEESMRQFNLGLKQQKSEFGDMMNLRRDYRNIQYGQLGLQALGLGLNAFLKNKDITYGMDWLDKLNDKYGIFDQMFGSGGGYELPSDIANFNLDFDLPDVSNIFEGAGGSVENLTLF